MRAAASLLCNSILFFCIRGEPMHKALTALAVAAAMAFAVVAAPDQADARWRGHRGGSVAAGVLGGLAAGAILGGIAANQGYYYGPGGYYGDYYGPGYYYGPGPYAYEPPPVVYLRPAPRYRGGGCWIVTDSTRGFGYYGPC
jgi:hypothetical protein